MKFMIPGIPISQQRHRDTIRGGKRFKYDPLSKQKNEIRKVISSFWAVSLEEDLPTSDYYHVKLKFYFPVILPERKEKVNAKFWDIEKCVNNKDLDNLEKFILDCMTGILLHDDRQVVNLSSEKLYSDTPRTEIDIKGYMMKDEEHHNIVKMLSPGEFLQLTTVCNSIARMLHPHLNFTGKPLEEHIATIDKNYIARKLSELAEITSPYLPKIKKKYPEYYKKRSDGI